MQNSSKKLSVHKLLLSYFHSLISTCKATPHKSYPIKEHHLSEHGSCSQAICHSPNKSCVFNDFHIHLVKMACRASVYTRICTQTLMDHFKKLYFSQGYNI